MSKGFAHGLRTCAHTLTQRTYMSMCTDKHAHMRAFTVGLTHRLKDFEGIELQSVYCRMWG